MHSLQHLSKQSTALKTRGALPAATRPPTAKDAWASIQRAPTCACGGSCPRCQAEPRLVVGSPDHRYEREADAVADRVMRMEDAGDPITPVALGLQRNCASCEESDHEDGLLQAKASGATANLTSELRLGAKGSSAESEAQTLANATANRPEPDAMECGYALDTSASPQDINAPPVVRHVLQKPGRALGDETRMSYENRFGAALDDVRVHDDREAQDSAAAIGAQAYTAGAHVVLSPTTSERSSTFAHELVHVLQQRGRVALVQRTPGLTKGAVSLKLGTSLGGANLSGKYRHEDAPPDLDMYPYARLAKSVFQGIDAAEAVAAGSEGKWLRFDLDIGWTFWLRFDNGQRQMKLAPQMRTTVGEIQRQLALPGDASVSIELADAPPSATSEGRVFLWLVSHVAQIVTAESTHGVDRRAIAGAIAWEALKNPWAATAGGAARFSGPGKVHFKEHRVEEGNPVAREIEQRNILPQQTMTQRSELLATAAGAINYIGAIMRAFADAGAMGGYHLHCDPPMLTTFFNAWDLDDAEARFQNDLKAPRALTPGPDMGSWVQANMSFIETAVGTPPAALCSMPRGY